MSWRITLLTLIILVSQKIFDVNSTLTPEEGQKEAGSKRVEAEDHIEIIENLKKRAQEDKTRETATGYEVLEDNEHSQIASLYQEFEKARLAKNTKKMNSAMAAFFDGMDIWFNEAKKASKENHKAALINAYKNVITTLEEGLAKEGSSDLEIKENYSDGTKFLKNIIKYEKAKTDMLKAKSDADRESAINLALKYREAAKDHVRAMSHDEL